MKQTNLFLFSLLFGAVVIAQDELGVEISSSGPNVTLNVHWYPSECDRSEDENEDNSNRKEKEYTVQICNKSKQCEKFNADPGRKISINKANFPLHFWSTYKITVKVNCGFPINWIGHARRTIWTGPGELPPPEGVNVTPKNTTALVEWSQPVPEIQKAVSYLGIIICDIQCYSEVLLAKENPDYKQLDLQPGVQYSASVRYIDVEKKYGSQFTNVSFETLPPPESKFPKVDNFAVKVIENLNDTDIEVTYSMPSEHPGTFWGVEVGISSSQGKFLPGIVRSDRRVIKIKSLPKFLNPTVHIYALYKVSGLTVKSVELTKQIHTGIGTIEKPKIVSLFAISDTTAVVEWSHSARESDEFLYQIQWGKNESTQVSLGKVNYFAIEGLAAHQTYNVTIMAYILYDNVEYRNSSDVQMFSTLSKDALVPKLKIDKITVLDIQVSWEVELPTVSPSNCIFTISVCPDEKRCHFYTRIPFDQKSMSLEDYPLRYHNVSMWTECQFYDTTTVSKKSETLREFTIFTPSPVKITTHRAVSESSLRLTFTPGDPYEIRMVGEYEIQYMESGHEETLKTISVIQDDFVTLEHLKTATSYNISVSAIIDEPSGQFRRQGPPVYVTVSTLAPSPEEVKNFKGEQISNTPNLQLSWDGSNYKYGGVKYSIKIQCGQTVPDIELDTNYTSVLVPVTSHKVESIFNSCEVLIKVVTTEQEVERSSDIFQQRVSFQAFGPPLAVNVTTPTDYSYMFGITPPMVNGASNFTYQVWKSGQFDEWSNPSDRPEMIITDVYSMISAKARVCIQELCGEAMSFSFVTNVGIPSKVQSVKALIVKNTNVQLFWKTPLTPHGPIDGYSITVIDAKTNEKKIFYSPAHELGFLYSSDKEHAQYEIHVHAFNNDLYSKGRQRHGQDAMIDIRT